MFGNLKTKGICAQVRNLAEKLNRSFRVAAFQFTICGAHAAERLQLAAGADGLAFTGGIPDFTQASVPTLFESAIAQVDALFVREHANGHFALGIDGATVLPTAASVFLRPLLAGAAGQFVFGHFEKFGFADGVTKIERNDLLEERVVRLRDSASSRYVG